MKSIFNSMTLSMVLAAAASSGCSGGAQTGQSDNSANTFLNGIAPTVRNADKLGITDATVDYSMALRSAALKLTGNLPTFAEIKELRDSTDQATTYAARIDDYLSRPSFAAMQVSFWRNTFKMGNKETVGVTSAMMDYAPTYAAMLAVQGADFSQVLTATTNTCQTFDGTNFTPVSCGYAAGTPISGVLSDVGVNQQFFSSMAFRRARWLQETFMCARFPAEQTGKPISYPGGVYQSPWPWNSTAGSESVGTQAKVDFQSNDSLICANCHSTLNHIAPLFGKFDATGKFVSGAAFQVITPTPLAPFSELIDWLPTSEGQSFAWRFQKPTPTLPALGAAVAADPGFARCMTNRYWNWAMSRGDAVADGTTITDGLAGRLVPPFVADHYNIKKMVKRIFTDPTFVRY
jgi:hypothetical protein